MRKRVYLARSFAASSRSLVTACAGVAGGAGATEGSAICGDEAAEGGKEAGGGTAMTSGGKRTDGRTLRSKSEDLLQSIAKPFGLFDGVLAIISHLDEGE